MSFVDLFTFVLLKVRRLLGVIVCSFTCLVVYYRIGEGQFESDDGYVLYHDYCLHPNLFAPNAIENEDRITLVMHVDANYFNDKIVDQAPVSLVLVLKKKYDYGCSYQKVKEILSTHPEVAALLRVHFMFSVDWSPKCAAPIDTPIQCVKRNYSEADAVKYPINIARNSARKFVTTKYSLMADYDHRFSAGFEIEVRRVAAERLTEKRVLVYRVFEIEREAAEPTEISILKNIYAKGEAVEFHARYYGVAHHIPGLKKWFQSNETKDIDIENIRYKNWEWEPFFVSKNDIPLYDVLFPYQFRNHAEISWELCRAGYQFDVLNKHFVYHRGVKTTQKLSKEGLAKAARVYSKALKAWKSRMNEQFPQTRVSCPEPH